MINVENPTSLEDRMRKHTPGQVTWPEPKLNLTCEACALFHLGKGLSKKRESEGWGRCEKAFSIAGKNANPVAFIGAKAIACPQIEK